jgi:glucosamine kinase
MILIADSGSTKTDWRLIDEEKRIHQFTSQGINPYFQTSEQISEILKTELVSFLIEHQISNIFFYGAGCRVEEKKQIVRNALQNNFKNTTIKIETDMLGAARSLCGRKPGIAAILGTGMNTCFYNGNEIAENRTSLGFILGDEGSGAHIGKLFIADYLNDDLPEELILRFKDRNKLSKDDIIDSVYRQPLPNRFLATFSKFIYQNLKEQYCIDLVRNSFEQFFDKYICKYPQHRDLKLSCTGSVAYYYSNILRSVAESRQVNIDVIVETPIAGLTLYHLGEE